MKKTSVVSLICLFMMCGGIYGAEKSKAKSQLVVDAATQATPFAGRDQLVITGELGPDAKLKDVLLIKVKKAIQVIYDEKGKPVMNKNGKPQFQYGKSFLGNSYTVVTYDKGIETDLKKFTGREVIVIGKIDPEKALVNVSFVKLSVPKKGYTCTMCGGEFHAPGKCPKCGMDLKEKK